MAFPDYVVEQAWNRAGGRCECPGVSHGHSDPHGKKLVKANRGREGEGSWEATTSGLAAPTPWRTA